MRTALFKFLAFIKSSVIFLQETRMMFLTRENGYVNGKDRFFLAMVPV